MDATRGTRARETLAMLAVGDGVIGAALPRRHVRRWQSGPEWWRQTMQPFVDRPLLTRAVAAAEAAAGIWYAARLPSS